jgi:transcriptional repressor NrdR
MNCPVCGHRSRVIETRPVEEGVATRRRRACEGCGERFTTFERIESRALYVRKRDGSRERFDREKVLGGLLRAAHKRPVDRVALEQLADRITGEVAAAGGELPARRIGEMALAGLRSLDRVAYMQFAAVYKSFRDPSEFSAELAEIDEPGAGEPAAAALGSVRPESDPA